MINFFDYIFYILGAMVNIGAAMYIWKKLDNNKTNVSKLKSIISFTILVIINCLIYFNVKTSIRVWIVSGIFILSNIFLFKNTIKEAIIKMLFSQSIMIISEFVVCLILALLFKITQFEFINNFSGTLLINFFISLLAIALCNIKVVKKVYVIITQFVNRINNYNLIIICLTFILVADILSSLLYYEHDFRYILIFNTFLTVFCLIIMIISVRTNNKYNEINKKYITTISVLRDYEDMINQYRIINHENKNSLLTVRGMISCDKNNIKKYIDSIIKQNYSEDNSCMKQVALIPQGGLRGLIYTKLNIMKNKKINYFLHIDKKVKVNCFDALSDDVMIDICKVIGVFLDNAIEEVEDKLEKNININLYKENKSKYCISIVNNINSNINKNDIIKPGYTTKNKGHGYGLTLVNQIINNNKCFKLETIIGKNNLSQNLYISVK